MNVVLLIFILLPGDISVSVHGNFETKSYCQDAISWFETIQRIAPIFEITSAHCIGTDHVD